MSELNEQVIREWRRATFPDATGFSAFRHLAEEVIELRVAMELDDGPNIEEEIGDVGLLLISIAETYGLSVSDCIMRKFETASARTYRYNPELGYAKHVSEVPS